MGMSSDVTKAMILAAGGRDKAETSYPRDTEGAPARGGGNALPMKVSLSEFTMKAALVKRSSRYEVYDLSLEQLVISMTVLHEGKSTVGHSHDDTEEIYLVVEGEGEIQLGDRGKEEVVNGDIVMIPRGVFHRVFNKGKGALTFVCFFEKYHGRGK